MRCACACRSVGPDGKHPQARAHHTPVQCHCSTAPVRGGRLRCCSSSQCSPSTLPVGGCPNLLPPSTLHVGECLACRAEIERLTAELQELEASQRQPLASPDNESPGQSPAGRCVRALPPRRLASQPWRWRPRAHAGGGLAAPGEAGAAAAAAAAHGGGWAASKRRRHAPRAEAAQRDWPEWARGQHALLVRRRKELSHALLAQVREGVGGWTSLVRSIS